MDLRLHKLCFPLSFIDSLAIHVERDSYENIIGCGTRGSTSERRNSIVKFATNASIELTISPNISECIRVKDLLGAKIIFIKVPIF